MSATGDLLGIATGGLLAFKRALSTTGHNITNVNTDGYSRQRVELATQTPQLSGAGFIGSGVKVTGVTRAYDQFVTDQVRNSNASASGLNVYHQMASQLSNVLGDSSTGLSAGLNSFFNAVQGVANDPTSVPARQVLLGEGQSLVNRFHTLNKQLSDQRTSVNGQLKNAVNDINSLAGSIASLNQSIVNETGKSGGQPPNDLLDQRDQLLKELSSKVAVSTVTQDDGSVNVSIGKGQALVTGFSAASLSFTPAASAGQSPVISYGSQSASVPVTRSLSGGKVGGLLDYFNQVLDPAQHSLDRLAVSVGSQFNLQHQKGMTLTGAQGGDFFSVGSPTVQAQAGNSSSAAVQYNQNALSSLTTSDYVLSYNGGWTLTRSSDGKNISLSGSGTAASPFTADGLSIVVSGSPANGDQFTISPTQGAARDIGLSIQDPNAVAAALPVSATAAGTNSGGVTLGNMSVQDPSNTALKDTVNIKFTSPSQFDVVDTTSGTTLASNVSYTSGQTLQYNGWSATLTGTPANNDSFTVGPNTGGVGDNRNALALAGLQNGLTMDGGSASFQSDYGALVSDVGTKTQQAQTNYKTQDGLLKQAEARRASVSGVNLDEEAANLVHYQQAYQAAAQVVTTANTMFQTLLTAVRG